MKLLPRLISTAAIGAALMSASLAQAATWNWSYSGPGVTASGTFTTAGNAASFEDLLSITGTRNGTAITGLVPLGSDPNYIYDNQFNNSSPYLTEGGWLYNIGGSGPDSNINIYFDSTDFQYHDLRLDALGASITDTIVTMTVTAVPEAATYGYMALGLAGMGLVLRRRKAA
jgi:hypothetical protein